MVTIVTKLAKITILRALGNMGSRDSSVGIATGYGLDGYSSIPVRDEIILYSVASRRNLEPIPAFYPRG
jgi:hypothetical protein